MRGGYQIIDLSSAEIGNETIVDNIYNTIKNYDEKPVFIITPNNSGVFAEFSNNNNMYIGAYIGSNGHLFTVSIISSNSVTITDKGQAGGSGTSNYDELSNKPAIAGTTLSGDKSLSNLGIQGELTAGNNITIQGNEISANVESMAASRVTYDNTTSGLNADNVQDAITELNSNTSVIENRLNSHYDTQYIDLAPYTSSNRYVCPCDGYAYVSMPSTQSVVYIDNIAAINCPVGSAMTCFVKKGMTLCSQEGYNSNVSFIPFEQIS